MALSLSNRELKGSYDHRLVEPQVMGEVLKTRGEVDGLLLDGPPFVSGIPHPGTVWNKVMKDVYIRYSTSKGKAQTVRPGYDCHGLPIELAVQKELGITAKDGVVKYGLDNFVKKCDEMSKKNMRAMTRVFQRLGVAMDWEHPYCTSETAYVEAEWREFKELYDKGLVTREKRVFYWCPKDETVLSDYEVNNYVEIVDRSIYVKFRVESAQNEYLLVWTTTPWTIPANVALMVNPDEEYVEAELNGNTYILAEKRLSVLGPGFSVKRKFRGSELDGVKYVHPLGFLSFQAMDHRVVLSKGFVSAEEGTGIVHVAPAHGQEDFQVGKENGLPMLDLVDEKGRYRPFVERYAGKYVREANDLIISDLRSAGALFKEEPVSHRYPVCWRCGTPLIMRPTEQWLLKVSSVKDELVNAASEVGVIPPWLKEGRFLPWLKGLGDWVVSRQRYWGTPMPIWVCDKCGDVKVIGSLKELESLTGKKIASSLDLHRPLVDELTFKHSCGGTMKRIPDVFDVWFDSGSAPYASTGRWPPTRYELVLEGQDQFSGWFASLAKLSVMLWSTMPYSKVLAHGMALDESGREMHKSLGNYVDVEEVVNEYGADAFRAFFLGHTPWEDVRFTKKGLEDALKKINTLWNLLYFASTYMALDDYHPREPPRLEVEDRWVLSRLMALEASVTSSMESLQFDSALKSLLDFMVDDLSKWYVKLIRKRTWVEKKDDPSKEAAYYALYWSLDALLRMLHPFVPFVTTFLMKYLPDEDADFAWPAKSFPRDEDLEKRMEVTRGLVAAALYARNKAGIKVRHPLKELLVSGAELGELSGLVAEQVNVKRVVAVDQKDVMDKKTRVRYDVLGSLFHQNTRVAAEKAIAGEKEVEIDGKKYEIPGNAIEVYYEPKPGYVMVEFEGYKAFLNTAVDEELEREALLRELVRRVQETRKRAKLSVEDRIDLVLLVPREMAASVSELASRMVDDTRAVSIRVSQEPPDGEWFSQDWDLDGFELKVYLRKANG